MDAEPTKAPVLFVDDEPNVLAGITRHLQRSFEVTTATSGPEGLAKIEQAEREFAVVVSDMRMPQMSGIDFLMRVRQRSPDSVRIMLTGNADVQTAIAAVNEGNVFRFLTKPCPPTDLLRAVIAGLRQHRLLKAEQELLEQTLRGSVKVLTEVLSLVKPAAFGRATRVRSLVTRLAGQLAIEQVWQLEVAAMLSQIGCVIFPEETMQKLLAGEALDTDEQKLLESLPQLGHDLVANIPRMEEVARCIRHQRAGFAGSRTELEGAAEEEIPLGARVLRVALDFDELTALGNRGTEALEVLDRREGCYDPAVLGALSVVVSEQLEDNRESLTVEQLKVGMVFLEDVCSRSGKLLASSGTEVTLSMIGRLKSWKPIAGVREPISVALGE